MTYEGYGCPHLPFLMEGVLAMEMARVDASIATFFGVQSGLAMGSIYLLGFQNHLVEMLSNLTAMQTMVFRLSQLQDENKLTDEHASLAKVFCTLRTRDIVSRAREVMGGNGILLQYDVARFVADAEAIYSYEGTKEINSPIVGRAITGISAFV